MAATTNGAPRVAARRTSVERSPFVRTSRHRGPDFVGGLLGAEAHQPRELSFVGAQRAVALLQRREQLDDRLADVLLELAVALAVVARLDLGDRRAGRHRHDLDQVRDARLLLRVVLDLAPGVGDRRLELLPDHVRRVDQPHDALRRVRVSSTSGVRVPGGS